MEIRKVGYLKLSEIRKILADSGLMLTKSLGQNFLHDGNQLARIVSLASINPGDRVLEVGPGMGALTGPLLDAGAHVTSIEKDQRLVDFLKNHRLQNHPRFELIHDDALDLIKRHDRDWTGFKFVSNLPYSVGSPIIVELALSAAPPDILVISLQLEVIERIFAGAGKKEYGLLSILMQLTYEPVEYFKLPSGCFFPPPDVTSACGLLVRRPERPVKDRDELLKVRDLVKKAFQQRRKTLANSLKPQYTTEQVVAALDSVGHPPLQRPDKLSPDEFVQFFRLLTNTAD